jgi:hypothetical protein
MEPGPVSVRLFQACFPQTSSDQVDPVAGPGGTAAGSGCMRWLPSRAAPFCFPWKASISKIDSFESCLEEMEQLVRPPESLSLLPVSPGLIVQR